MSATKDSAEQRKLRSVARQYVQAGYRVTIPAEGGQVPAFLEGLAPDLIAESDGDRVIVEIKQNRALRGSNELEEIADRVSRQSGWRFELVAIPSIEKAPALDREWFDRIADRARTAMRYGLTDAAYAYAWSVIEILLADLAGRYRLSVNRKSIALVGRDLVTRGIIPQEALEEIERARAIRNRMVHLESEVLPTAAEVEQLLALGRRLREELTAAAAA